MQGIKHLMPCGYLGPLHIYLVGALSYHDLQEDQILTNAFGLKWSWLYQSNPKCPEIKKKNHMGPFSLLNALAE